MQDQLLGGRYRLVRSWRGAGRYGRRGMRRWPACRRQGDLPARRRRKPRRRGTCQIPARGTDHRSAAAPQHRDPPRPRGDRPARQQGAVPGMELIRGEGLDAKLRRGAVTLPDAARWGAQISDALADAHNTAIIPGHQTVQHPHHPVRHGEGPPLRHRESRTKQCGCGDPVTRQPSGQPLRPTPASPCTWCSPRASDTACDER